MSETILGYSIAVAGWLIGFSMAAYVFFYAIPNYGG